MSVSLADALRQVDLQSGHVYRETVNGRTVEVRVLDDAPTPELADRVMREQWVELPFDAVGTVRARAGTMPLPDPPAIPADDGDGE
jgi:hypothetical protein